MINLLKTLLYLIKTNSHHNYTRSSVVSGDVIGLNKARVRFPYFPLSKWLLPRVVASGNGCQRLYWVSSAMAVHMDMSVIEGYLSCILVQLTGRDHLPSNSLCYWRAIATIAS